MVHENERHCNKQIIYDTAMKKLSTKLQRTTGTRLINMVCMYVYVSASDVMS